MTFNLKYILTAGVDRRMVFRYRINKYNATSSNSLFALGLILSGCGGAGKNSLSDSENNSSENSTNLINNSGDITASNVGYVFSRLSSYDNIINFHHYDELYSDPEIKVVSKFDQSRSERYDYGFKNSTNTALLSGENIIDGLLYEFEGDSKTTEYWYLGEPNLVSYSFFDKDLLLLHELDYTYFGQGLSWEVYNNDFYAFTDQQKASVRLALAEFSKVINVEFVEVIEELENVGTLRFGISAASFDDASAFATPPGNIGPVMEIFGFQIFLLMTIFCQEPGSFMFCSRNWTCYGIKPPSRRWLAEIS